MARSKSVDFYLLFCPPLEKPVTQTTCLPVALEDERELRGQTIGKSEGRTDRWMDGWMVGRTDGRMDGQPVSQTASQPASLLGRQLEGRWANQLVG